MKIKELKQILKSEIRDNYTIVRQPWELLKLKHLDHLEVQNIEILYTLKLKGLEWEFSIEERGNLRELKTFTNESDACEYFKKVLIRK